MESQLKLVRRLYDVMIFLVLTVGCGVAALNGLEPGENRGIGPGAIVPGPVAPEAPDAPPTERYFVGEVDQAVDLRSGDHVIFDRDNPPVFKKYVNVEAGVSMVGPAHFVGGLGIFGTRGDPVVWRLRATEKAKAEKFEIQWLNLSGGSFELVSSPGRIGQLKDSSFIDSEIVTQLAEEGRIDITRCHFNGGSLNVEGVTKKDAGSARTLLVLGQSVFYAIQISLDDADHFAWLDISGNNFGQLEDRSYFVNIDFPEGDRAWSDSLNGSFSPTALAFNAQIVGQNYFTRSASFAALPFVEGKHLHVKPFVAGPGSSDEQPDTQEGRQRLVVDYTVERGWCYRLVTQSGSYYHYHSCASYFSSLLQKSMNGHLANYSYDLSVMGRLDLQAEISPPDCQIYSDRWWTTYYTCSPRETFTLPMKLIVANASGVLREIHSDFIYENANGHHVESRAQQTALDIIDQLVGANYIQQITIQTPFY